ncbi:MAG TPA: response regulator [Calditrichaeota bacterium]|nr:response regulator [Calditrichota bacterium]
MEVTEKRVLIVDDEEDLTWSISRHLSKDKDKYELMAVNNAREALDILKQVPVTVVVSDIRMPEISGLELLMEIRKNYPDTKVIIMTAYGSSEVQQEANARGCFKYIEKPFEIQELRQIILEGVEDKKGFDGRISDLQLSDLIQMHCLGRLTNALQVQKDHYKGIIYFENGDIVHAKVGNEEGEEAFYEILSWEGGSFAVQRGAKAPKESIHKGWQTLLLEGLRRLDEKRSPEEHRLVKETKKKQENMYKVLKQLSTLKDFILAAVFDSEGFPLNSIIGEKHKQKYKLSEIATTIAKLHKQIEITAMDLKMTETSEIALMFNEGICIITNILNKRAFLVLLAGQSSNLALLRMKIKGVLNELEKSL